MEKDKQIYCPNCGEPIDVSEVLRHQVEEDLKLKMHQEIAKEKQKFEKEFELLQKQKEDFEEKRKRENELFQEKLQQKIKEEKIGIEQQVKTKLEGEQAERFKLLEAELNEKQEQLKELSRAKTEVEQLKRNQEIMKEQITMEAEKALSVKLIEERDKIKKLEQDRTELTIKELQKQLEDQRKLTEEMKRKQEQGSMQLQGEVMELAIEEWLMQQFPFDTIEEIKKGARGGDCVQIVNTPTRPKIGTIYYESKRTKEFHAAWIEKFKQDIRDRGADIGVLVTDVYPAGMDRLGLKDGIWICSYEEFKGLCKVLRESLITLGTAIATQENKGDKMSFLYDFLTSNTFKMQIEAIVEGFTQMQSDLESEKRSFQRIWKQREKQIEKVITNTVEMYGNIKGIAGSAIGDIKSLELPSGDFEQEDN